MESALPDADIPTVSATPTVELRIPTGRPRVGRWVYLKQGNFEAIWQITSVVGSPDDETMQIVLVPLVMLDA